MSVAQIQQLREMLQDVFENIYQLCYNVLQNFISNSQSIHLSLIKACLNTFNAYFKWFNLDYIFKTSLIEYLLQLFDSKDLQLLCLKLLTEIISLPDILTLINNGQDEAKQNVASLYSNFLAKLETNLSSDVNLLQQRIQLIKERNPTLGYFNSFCKVVFLY